MKWNIFHIDVICIRIKTSPTFGTFGKNLYAFDNHINLSLSGLVLDCFWYVEQIISAPLSFVVLVVHCKPFPSYTMPSLNFGIVKVQALKPQNWI